MDEVWANWEKIKKAEKHGTRHARPSALDGIPDALARAIESGKAASKGARKAKLPLPSLGTNARTRTKVARELA